MGIELYPHNETAYRKAVTMIANSGKAAVIHPTGTGKSMIGFKLCEDNPDKRVCWLAPSEYIFNTQLENLKDITSLTESGSNVDESVMTGIPANINFCTYAKLAYMSNSEIEAMRPDIIILDEFHRCGAEVWGIGVERLLSYYPNAPLLGLTATAIRYLDNQRNMADELFDCNIASEMTLGEAIIRGILNPPKYVLSIYSYADSLEKYETRVKALRYKNQRDRASKYLEELRRALNNADGLDDVFDRHMTDRTGKYIIFCSNYNAMKEAMDKASEWFAKVDGRPHIYSVYSDDVSANKSFVEFKEDNDDSHLRLLYCIDALNEGVHVKDVSGVILLRPTVSPIVYKQQIGRTLSASKSKMPVIFDIVNNIENLYSIDAIKEEMEAALSYMRFELTGDQIVNDSFQIISEVRNCIELFDELEGVLTSTWETMYMEAKQHFDMYGNLSVQHNFITETGYPLGRWLATQRTNRRKGDPSLDEERIARLDEIGMDWNYSADRNYQKGYEHAKAYYDENGNLEVPAAFITKDGFHLGSWCRIIKDRYQEGRLAEGYAEALEDIGMKWESVFSRKWKKYLECARGYYAENGDLNVPIDYVCDEKGRKVEDAHDGKNSLEDITGWYRLGVWISTQRDNYSKGRLSEEQIAVLEELHMSWDRRKSKWDKGFEYALKYINENGDINSIPTGYKYDDFNLSNWIRAQRVSFGNGRLSKERIDKLEAIGFIWNPQEALWEKGYIHAADYVRTHGNIDVPPHYVCEDGYKLKSWLINQGTRFKTGRMPESQRLRLEKLGMSF